MPQNRRNHEEPANHADDNPALSKVVERNIRTMIQLRLQAARARSVQELLADAITDVSGRMVFVYVHIVWFGVWILLNTGRVKHGQGLLYTSGELPRLMRSGPPRRAVTAVWEGELVRAALPGRDR